jgi:hypothetical protein
MSEGISRRQFVGGAAAVAAASALPVVTSAAPAIAADTIKFPLATPDWVPLDAQAAARLGWEIHAGYHPGQSS